MKTITLKVTQADIAAGEKARELRRHGGNAHYCSTCPVAKALRRALRRFVEVIPHYSAHSGVIAVGRTLRQTEYRLPELLRKWVDQFDSSQPVKPFTTRMRLRKI